MEWIFSSVTRYISEPGQELDKKAFEVVKMDSALRSSIPCHLREPIKDLLRTVNSYYSSKIEGNSTQPSEILRSKEMPQKEETLGIKEIKHLMEMHASLAELDTDEVSIVSPDFIKSIHEEFYKDAPDDVLNIKSDSTDNTIRLVPGQFREHDVDVGTKFHAPSYQLVPGSMDIFKDYYRQDRIPVSRLAIVAAAAHHRFLHIHPFLDGNGRVARLLTTKYLQKAGLDGIGFWSINREFGRNTKAYYHALGQADSTRQSDTDGRGVLSDKGLEFFTNYFLDAAIEQLTYFTNLFDAEALAQRVDSYFLLRTEHRMIVDGERLPLLDKKTWALYKELFHSGPLMRDEAQSRLDIDEKTLAKILRQMRNAGLIKTPRLKPIEIDLSPSSLEMLFPRLMNV